MTQWDDPEDRPMLWPGLVVIIVFGIPLAAIVAFVHWWMGW
jgi:hypothetical protein